jgi:hypothetical protein
MPTATHAKEKETRHVKYVFNAVEVHELSLQMANKNMEHDAIVDEKKTVTSQYAARLNEVKSTLSKLSQQVANGYDMRPIEFTVKYHTPSTGMKTLTPVDASVDPIVEKMNPMDNKLFEGDGVLNTDDVKGKKAGEEIPFEDLPKDDGKITHALVAPPASEDTSDKKPLFKDDGDASQAEDPGDAQPKKKKTSPKK